jgi:hypothetical protein
MIRLSTRRVGGIRFFRIGIFCFSFCVSRKRKPIRFDLDLTWHDPSREEIQAAMKRIGR